MHNFVFLVSIMNNCNLLVVRRKIYLSIQHLMINMHIVSSTSIILTFGLILGLLGGSFLSSSHLSAFAQKPPIHTGQEQHLSSFAQTPSSTNRVTAGQQQSTFGQHQGPTSLLPLSNQSTFAKIPNTKRLDK
jgi:hypothetical protein